MQQIITHNTGELTLGGMIAQKQLKIGNGTGPLQILFDNGAANLPGIRFLTATDAFDAVNISGCTEYPAVNQQYTAIPESPEDWISADGVYYIQQTKWQYSSSKYRQYKLYQLDTPNDITSSWTRILSGYTTTSATPNNPAECTMWSTLDDSSATAIAIAVAATTIPAMPACWQYTDDGTHWYTFGTAGSTITLGSPITFTKDDLNANGNLIIHHNLNTQYLLGVDSDPIPDSITYQDANTLVLGYGSYPSTFTGGIVWFYNSNANMALGGQ